MSSPFQDHSCFCLLNKVGQRFGKHGIKGYFDAKIRPFPSVKYNLFFTNFGISYEFEGNCFLLYWLFLGITLPPPPPLGQSHGEGVYGGQVSM